MKAKGTFTHWILTLALILVIAPIAAQRALALDAPPAPELATCTNRSVTLKAVEAPEGYTVQYGVGTRTNWINVRWQAEPTFTADYNNADLTPKTGYYFLVGWFQDGELAKSAYASIKTAYTAPEAPSSGLSTLRDSSYCVYDEEKGRPIAVWDSTTSTMTLDGFIGAPGVGLSLTRSCTVVLRGENSFIGDSGSSVSINTGNNPDVHVTIRGEGENARLSTRGLSISADSLSVENCTIDVSWVKRSNTSPSEAYCIWSKCPSIELTDAHLRCPAFTPPDGAEYDMSNVYALNMYNCRVDAELRLVWSSFTVAAPDAESETACGYGIYYHYSYGGNADPTTLTLALEDHSEVALNTGNTAALSQGGGLSFSADDTSSVVLNGSVYTHTVNNGDITLGGNVTINMGQKRMTTCVLYITAPGVTITAGEYYFKGVQMSPGVDSVPRFTHPGNGRMEFLKDQNGKELSGTVRFVVPVAATIPEQSRDPRASICDRNGENGSGSSKQCVTGETILLKWDWTLQNDKVLDHWEVAPAIEGTEIQFVDGTSASDAEAYIKVPGCDFTVVPVTRSGRYCTVSFDMGRLASAVRLDDVVAPSGGTLAAPQLDGADLRGFTLSGWTYGNGNAFAFGETAIPAADSLTLRAVLTPGAGQTALAAAAGNLYAPHVGESGAYSSRAIAAGDVSCYAGIYSADHALTDQEKEDVGNAVLAWDKRPSDFELPDGSPLSALGESDSVTGNGRYYLLLRAFPGARLTDGKRYDVFTDGFTLTLNGEQTVPLYADAALYVCLLPLTVVGTHTLRHADARAATCTGYGMAEYWTCTECHQYFSDAGGNTEVDWDSFYSDPLGGEHEWSEAGVCTRCRCAAEAELNGVYFSCLEEALDAAEELQGDAVITLLADVNDPDLYPEYYELDRLTLELNGHSLTCTVLNLFANELTIQNGSLNACFGGSGALTLSNAALVCPEVNVQDAIYWDMYEWETMFWEGSVTLLSSTMDLRGGALWAAAPEAPMLLLDSASTVTIHPISLFGRIYFLHCPGLVFGNWTACADAILAEQLALEQLDQAAGAAVCGDGCLIDVPGAQTLTLRFTGSANGVRWAAVNDGGISCVVTAPANSLLLAVSYDAAGRQTGVRTVSVGAAWELQSGVVPLTVTSGGSYKILLVHTGTYVPLCEAWDDRAQ